MNGYKASYPGHWTSLWWFKDHSFPTTFWWHNHLFVGYSWFLTCTRTGCGIGRILKVFLPKVEITLWNLGVRVSGWSEEEGGWLPAFSQIQILSNIYVMTLSDWVFHISRLCCLQILDKITILRKGQFERTYNTGLVKRTVVWRENEWFDH